MVEGVSTMEIPYTVEIISISSPALKQKQKNINKVKQQQKIYKPTWWGEGGKKVIEGIKFIDHANVH